MDIITLALPVLVGLLIFAVLVLMMVSMWKIYTKANQPGWASIVPVYNMIVMLEITKQPMWLLILFFIPYVNIVAAIVVTWKLGEVFGKDTGFRIGLIILPVIFYPMLGFDDSNYQDRMAVPAPPPEVPRPEF